jgi:hypothetical protein
MSMSHKKVLGDEQVVTIKGNYSEGLGDMQVTRDAVVALAQELNDLYTITAASADYATFQAALAARGPLKFITFIY